MNNFHVEIIYEKGALFTEINTLSGKFRVN